MLRQPIRVLVPVVLSVVEFDLDQGAEIFFTYTHGREHGPEIQRTGRGSPFMEHLYPAHPGETTSDPDGLRFRTWLIQDDLRQADLQIVWQRLAPYVGPGARGEEPGFIRSWLANIPPGDVVLSLWEHLKHAEQRGTPATILEALSRLLQEGRSRNAPPEVLRVLDLWQQLKQAEAQGTLQNIVTVLFDLLEEAEQQGAPPETTRVLRAYVNENPKLTAHDTEFTRVYPQYEIIGQQGCGDLTMNLWNVACINTPLALGGRAVLIFLYPEPLASRTYSCLVKWTPNGDQRSQVTIEEVRFFANASTANEMVWVKQDGQWVQCGDTVEFAVSNQQILRDGKIVDISRLTHQFSDLRHLLQMANLNPPRALPDVTGDQGRPRFYYGSVTYDDIWFGEAQLIHNVNLQRAAMTGPIFLSRLYEGLGVSVEQVRGAMQLAAYTEVTDPRQDLVQGEFRFVPEDNTQVEVCLRRNTYGWTIIGLNQTNDKILCLACEGNPATRTGHVLEEATRQIVTAGAHNALLIDEGADVFQKALLGLSGQKAQVAGGPELDVTVPLKRTRLRAMFIFARRKPGATQGPGGA